MKKSTLCTLGKNVDNYGWPLRPLDCIILGYEKLWMMTYECVCFCVLITLRLTSVDLRCDSTPIIWIQLYHYPDKWCIHNIFMLEYHYYLVRSNMHVFAVELVDYVLSHTARICLNSFYCYHLLSLIIYVDSAINTFYKARMILNANLTHLHNASWF